MEIIINREKGLEIPVIWKVTREGKVLAYCKSREQARRFARAYIRKFYV